MPNDDATIPSAPSAPSTTGALPASSSVAVPETSPFLGPPLTSVPAVIERLDAIQRYIETHIPNPERDGIGCFNYLYGVITRRVWHGIESGFFADAVFLTELDLAFANRYFDALRASVLNPAETPKAWRVLIERRSDPRIEPIQFAVAGVNAHINFDLAVAVERTCITLRTQPNSGTQRADYEKINQIFAEEMQTLREYFEDDSESAVDRLAAPVLDVIGSWSVKVTRDAAWAACEYLWSLRRANLDQQPFLDRLDRLTALAGQVLLTRIH